MMRDDAWRRLCSHDTPWATLQQIVDNETHAALIAFLDTLLADADLTDATRARLWATAAPIIRREWRTTLEAGWRQLQLETLPADGAVQ